MRKAYFAFLFLFSLFIKRHVTVSGPKYHNMKPKNKNLYSSKKYSKYKNLNDTNKKNVRSELNYANHDSKYIHKKKSKYSHMKSHHPLYNHSHSTRKRALTKQYEKLFALYCKTLKKQYLSPSEFKFRFKSFIKNLGFFIQKWDDPLERIRLEYSERVPVRIVILPDKRLNVDFQENENEGSTEFELNRFSDMSQEEHDQIFGFDQSFFDEEKYPTNLENEKSDKGEKEGIQNIRNYIKKSQANGVKYDEDLIKKYFDGKIYIQIIL